MRNYVPFPRDEIESTIAGRFHRIVRRHGARVAIQSATRDVTYQELDAWTNCIARMLENGLDDGREPVAILLDQGVEFIAAIFGVLKAGCGYVPLDPSFPLERNLRTLADAGARVVVTSVDHKAAAHTLILDRNRVVCVDDIDGVSDAPVAASAESSAIAYVLYTSGSTGEPKGVRETHRNVLHNVMRHADAFEIGPEDRQSLLYPCSVYGGTRDIFNAILNGASLHPYAVKDNGHLGLFQWLNRHSITIYCSVATVFRYFAQSLPQGASCPTVRAIKLGGEASRRGDVELYRKHFADHCVLFGGLASTETGVVRQFRVDKTTPIESDPIPLGYAVPDFEISLVNEQGDEVPPGEVGEIVVRSRYLSPGYTRTDMTRRVFSEPQPGIREYRTGDLGRMRSDGCLMHAGRKDHQVKIRGNRVEMAEVEGVLSEQASVRDAVVTIQDDPRGERQLVAYFVCHDGFEARAEDLRALARKSLPDYMIPAAFVRLDLLPRTGGGKLNRKALPPVDWHAQQAPLAAPRTAQEEVVAAIWCEVFGLSAVGVVDDFFALGGHSLLATQIVSRLRERLGVELPVRALFEAPTVEKLSVLAQAAERERSPDARIARDPSDRYRLSFSETRFWFLEEYAPGKATYNVPYALRLRGALDDRALSSSLDDLIARHESLRTRGFVSVRDGKALIASSIRQLR